MIVRVGGGGVWQRPFDKRNKNTMNHETKYIIKTGGGWGGMATTLRKAKQIQIWKNV